MPQKSTRQRAKRAKAEGTTLTVKDSEVGRTGPRSAHGVKKSAGVAGRLQFTDRTVSPRAAPGTGKTRLSTKLPAPETGSTTSRRKTLPEPAAAGFRKDERRAQPSSEAKERRERTKERGSPVKGRKKTPSQMKVRRKGGPRKRSPLRGG